MFNKPRILILANHDETIYNFRLELVECLLENGYEVHISSPYGERTNSLVALGVNYHVTGIDRHGMNPVTEMSVLCKYRRLVSKVAPMVILSFTIKPNIYGGIVARLYHIPFIPNITGLGISIQGKGIKPNAMLLLYKLGLKKARMVYFQNQENQQFMMNHHIISGSYNMLPGSGVNLKKHCFEEYPDDTKGLVFTTICRVMKEKGVDELLEAAEKIKLMNPEISFYLIGSFEDNYQSRIEDAVKNGIIKYMGQQKNVHSYIKESHAIIHPSYHEGMSNVLLEAAATGRPVLASNISGCREIFEEGVSGFGFKPKSSQDLINVIMRFINLSYKEKADMGKAGRTRVEKYFDRNIVVDEYMREINRIAEEQNNVCRTV